MTVSEAQRLKELEQENNKLKRLLAESMLIARHRWPESSKPQAKREAVQS